MESTTQSNSTVAPVVSVNPQSNGVVQITVQPAPCSQCAARRAESEALALHAQIEAIRQLWIERSKCFGFREAQDYPDSSIAAEALERCRANDAAWLKATRDEMQAGFVAKFGYG